MLILVVGSAVANARFYIYYARSSFMSHLTSSALKPLEDVGVLKKKKVTDVLLKQLFLYHFDFFCCKSRSYTPS